MSINITDKGQTGDCVTGTSTSTTTTWRCPYTQHKAERGWECPRCGRINAPWKSSCDCIASNWQFTWGDTTADHENWWKTYIKCTTADTKVGGSDYYDNTTGIYHN